MFASCWHLAVSVRIRIVAVWRSERAQSQCTRACVFAEKRPPHDSRSALWILRKRHVARGAPHVLPQRFAAVDRTRAVHSIACAYAGSHSWHQLRCGHVRILPQRAHGGSSAICTAHDSGGSEGARAAARSCATRSSPVIVHLQRESVVASPRSAEKATGARALAYHSPRLASLVFVSTALRAIPAAFCVLQKGQLTRCGTLDYRRDELPTRELGPKDQFPCRRRRIVDSLPRMEDPRTHQ